MARGSDSRPSACSSVIWSPSMPRGSAVRRGFGLLVLAVLALLHIQAVRAAADGDLLAGIGMLAEDAHALLQRLALVLAVLDRQPPRVLAVRIVGTADEAAVAAQLQAQPAGAAGRAGARIGAVLARRKEMRPEVLVQRGDHVADLEVLGLVDRARELVPERAQHRPPFGVAVGDVVELLLHRGGEAGIDVVLEEADQEGGDQPAAILRDEAALAPAGRICGPAAPTGSRRRWRAGRCPSSSIFFTRLASE